MTANNQAFQRLPSDPLAAPRLSTLARPVDNAQLLMA